MAMRVSSVPLNDMCRRIDDDFDEMQRLLDQLQTRMTLLESQWDGEAREAFHTAIRSAHQSLSNLRALGNRVTGEVRRHVEDVGAIETRRASVWRR